MSKIIAALIASTVALTAFADTHVVSHDINSVKPIKNSESDKKHHSIKSIKDSIKDHKGNKIHKESVKKLMTDTTATVK